MNAIIVKKDHEAKAYTASFYVDGEYDLEIVGLFGTHIIPTPFTLNANPATVVATISQKNPGHDVWLG